MVGEYCTKPLNGRPMQVERGLGIPGLVFKHGSCDTLTIKIGHSDSDQTCATNYVLSQEAAICSSFDFGEHFC